LDDRHRLVSNLVWGLLLMGLGGLLTLHQLEIPLPEGVPWRGDEHPAEGAVDGDPGTRWSSQFRDGEWISVDLGEPREIERLRLVWERAYARVYEVQVSDDGSRWETAVREEEGQGETEEHALGRRARWLRVHGIERSTPYGISLYELEVYGAEGLISQGRPVTASSHEAAADRMPFLIAFWFTWWPLFLIAGALPGLLVPRSNGEETGGAVGTAAGLVFLLDNFGWSLREAAPLGLLLVGVVVLLQGMRRGRSGEAAPGDGARGA
jgi:hypothetical protein